MTLQELQTIKQRFGIIGTNPQLHRDIEIAVQVAVTDLSVLVTGESGVGKEFFPQIVHAYSPRKHGPYFAINCGAIPEGTIDSELFGHEKGAFTDAKADRKGYFEIADGGTLFLDEVGELPLSTQVRLLRVLETGEFIKVGSSQVQKTNVRVVAATNLDMQRAIQEGRFREDLYYRLSAIEIKVPALRDRKEDIPMLFRKFCVDFAEKNRMPPIRLNEEATQLLQSYYWYGNVRQLKNVAERISIIESERNIDAETLRLYLPENESINALAKVDHVSAGSDTYMNERELLYKVLFDMKRLHEGRLVELCIVIVFQQAVMRNPMKMTTAFERGTHVFAVHRSCLSADITSIDRHILSTGADREPFRAEVKLIIAGSRKGLLSAEHLIPINLEQFICGRFVEFKGIHHSLQASVFQ